MLKGNRKLLLSGFSVVLAFILAMTGKLDGNFTSIVVATVAAFSGANAVEHWRS